MVTFELADDITYLNHGALGACPRELTEAQARWRARMEKQPVDFFLRQLRDHFAAVREKLATFTNADAEGFAFVPNATAGVNTVMKSLDFSPGDELLTTNMAYGACRYTLDFMAEKTGAKVVSVDLPFPVENETQIFDTILAGVTDNTKLAMLDHIASPTGLILPIEKIVAALADRGIDTLVDGAHVIGQIPLDLSAIGAAYYTTNAHKWLCTPRGAAILHVREDRRDRIHPLSTSFGWAATEDRFRAEFDWTGTDDPTAYLVIPEAIDLLGGALDGGWPALYAQLHDRVIAGRRAVLEKLGLDAPTPDDMHGALAAILLPPGKPAGGDGPGTLNDVLWREHQIEVPVFPFPTPDARTIRLSAHLHTPPGAYARLGDVLRLFPEG